MSLTRSPVVPIFATPFATLRLPESQAVNAILAQLLAARAAADPAAAGPTHALRYRSRDDLMDAREEPLRTLCAELLRGVRTVVAAVNAFSDAQLESFVLQALAWFTIVRQDGALPACSYPLTSWLAIYCVEAPPPAAGRRDSGVLRLYESRLGTMFTDATNSVMRIPYTPGHYAWRPVPGEVAIFPASITHEIALIRSPGQLVLVTLRARFVAPGQQGLKRW